MELSIVIPACNEESRLAPMLDKYLPFFAARYAGDYEALIIVNGSRDRTEDIVRQYAVGYSNVRLIVEPRRIGKGGAVMLGMARARGRLIGFVDADGATPPEAFQDLVEHIGNAGVIIASRWLPGARINVQQPFKRRLASRMFNTFVRLLFGLQITDTQCGAKLMTRDAALAVLPHIGITHWAFDVDLLFQLRRAGYAILEIPTTWRDVSGSQLRVCKASIDMFVAMVRLRLLYSPFRWVVVCYDRTLAHLLKSPRFD